MHAPADQFWQLVRYGIVGLATNALLYGCYLLLASLGMGPKTAMSLLYVPGILFGFYGNRSFTFRDRGRVPASLARYFATYAFGYVFNFACLVVFVDVLGLPSRLVVLALIFVTAILLFLLQRHWVFASEPRPHQAMQ